MSNEPTQSQGSVTHYDNVQRPENCGTADARQCYSGHNGIDYALRYELVRAAAAGNVAYAGWDNVANHRAGYGLYVDVDHTNGFHTIYGHMSVLHVETGDPIPESDEFQRILGRSGNTGWCAGWEGTGPNNRCTDNDPPTCGAHLHFHVTHNERVVNPYGWISAAADPWSQRADGATSVDRWVRYPSITNGDVFPSGASLSAPPMDLSEPGYFIVDDGDTDYNETAGCWTVDNTAGWNNDYRRRNIPGGNCTATWNFSQTRPDGRYNVFVHIPNDNVAPGNRRATVDAARYAIRHTPSPSQPWSKQTQIVVVNQWAYPNNAHTSRWVYLGAYYFDTNQYGTDYVRLESDTMDSRAGVMAADAVRFAPVRYRTYLPLVLKCYPAIVPATPVLNVIDNSDYDGNYTVSWQPASGAETYTLQEATNPGFTGAATVYTGSDTAWSAMNKPVGMYYYRVRATNCAGNSGWSTTQQTRVLPPTWYHVVADTMILSGYPNTNYGSQPELWAGYDDWWNPDGKVARGLVRFDLAAIPAGTPINQATLWLFLYRSYDSQSVSRSIAAYRVATAWTEGGVTWNTRPSLGGVYGQVAVPHAVWGWYAVDVTDLARSWVNGQYSNYGIYLWGYENSAQPNWRSFCTREYNSECRARLQITYSGTQGATASPAPGIPETFRSPLVVPEKPVMLLEVLRSPLPTPGP